MNRNIRIFITDLIEACQTLGEVRVVAAGFMYATIECDDVMLQQLSKKHIHWSFD